MKRTTKRPSRKHAVNLTKPQFMTLLTAVFIANWVANGTDTEGRRRNFDDLEDTVFSHADVFGFPSYHQSTSTSDGRHYPTDSFQDESGVHEILDEYDDDIFWDMLVTRLAMRDFIRTYGQDAVDEMDSGERADKLAAFEARYEREVDEFGLERFSSPNVSAARKRAGN